MRSMAANAALRLKVYEVFMASLRLGSDGGYGAWTARFRMERALSTDRHR